MNTSLLNYKTLLKGGIITIVLTLVLNSIGFIIINPSLVLENILILGFWWLAISFLVYKIPYFKQNRNTVYKVLGLIMLLVIAMAADNYMQIPDNPITLPLAILFWLGLAYLILPQFFKKYKIAILSVYGAVLSYFFIFRMTPNYLEDNQQNVINFMLIPIPAFIALWGYEQWRWLKTLKADKGKAELALLKSQVNPHFFFNTLNNLYGLVVEKSAQAPEVVLKLSDMMRYTIYEGKEDLVSLANEVKYLENYIELHKIRYQKKVDIRFTHEVEKNIQVAPLLFIILLENAFKHGVERLTENAYIYLDLKIRNDQILFSIKNNYELNSSIQKVGIGLDNLNKRLTHIYPNRHELKIEKTASTYKTHLTLDLI